MQNEAEYIEPTSAVTGGDRNCYVYFNLQFTGLRLNTSIISLALVDCDGNSFYAEFTDYDETQVDEWITENVLKNLTHPETSLIGEHWTITGTREEISKNMFIWLSQIISTGKRIQFVGDVSHLSFSLLLDLILNDRTKTFMDLPACISPALLDINQDLAAMLYRDKPADKTWEEFDENYIPVATAFDINRIEATADILDMTGDYHYALYQAYIIRAIHQKTWALEK